MLNLCAMEREISELLGGTKVDFALIMEVVNTHIPLLNQQIAKILETIS